CANRTTRLFGPHRVDFAQIFFESPLSFALVNLKPIVPGHTLVVPKRVVDRFHKLDSDEVADLWQTAQLVGQKIEAHYHANSLTFAIQDGVSAGQTVPHVHIHVLPRQDGDFNPNDKIYDEVRPSSPPTHAHTYTQTHTHTTVCIFPDRAARETVENGQRSACSAFHRPHARRGSYSQSTVQLTLIISPDRVDITTKPHPWV
ncbi:TPA: hypothetical protein N0F65_006504, partial [Lagenidium giganteum]